MAALPRQHGSERVGGNLRPRRDPLPLAEQIGVAHRAVSEAVSGVRPGIPTFDFHIAWRRDNQSTVLHAFLEMLSKHVHAEAKGPEKTAARKNGSKYLT